MKLLKKRIVIIDYGMGNLRSVANAFEILNCEACVSQNPSDLPHATHLVLPGVGAFGKGMEGLRAGEWIGAINKAVSSGQPILGICLGLQILADQGMENGVFEGLAILPGRVDRLSPQDSSYRIPHIGWNDVEFISGARLFRGLGEKQTFYFVHSYVFQPAIPAVVSGWCEHGVKFAAALEFENIFATQFHPEKSQRAGLNVLKNFLEVD